MSSPLTPQQCDDIETVIAVYRQHPDIGFACCTAHPVADHVPALLATVRHLTERVAELEAYAYGCDAEGCTIPHSSWCEAAKKTAAQNDGCTCGKPWTGHPQPHAMHCWTVNPPRAEVQEMRKKVAEVLAGRDAAAIELREAARKAIAKAEAERDAPRTLTEGEYSAAWHAVEGAAGEEGADPGTILHAVLNRLGIALPGAVEPKAKEQSAEACGKCRTAFDPADTRFDGHARYYLTPYCKRCVDACHDNEIADHRCVICA